MTEIFWKGQKSLCAGYRYGKILTPEISFAVQGDKQT